MMDMTQNMNITDTSNVPFSLRVSMPQPDYFDDTNWATHNVDEITNVD